MLERFGLGRVGAEEQSIILAGLRLLEGAATGDTEIDDIDMDVADLEGLASACDESVVLAETVAALCAQLRENVVRCPCCGAEMDDPKCHDNIGGHTEIWSCRCGAAEIRTRLVPEEKSRKNE